MNDRGLYTGVLLISAATLALETLMPRVFAVYLAPNFAYFTISIALVGLSSGGIIVYLWESRLLERPRRNLVAMALLFSVSILLAAGLVYAAGSALNGTIDGIYAEILGRDHAGAGAVLSESIVVPSMLFVLASGFSLAVPFLLGGTCIALAFRWYSKAVDRVYAFDLFGAAVGCGFTVVGLSWFPAATALLIVGAMGAVAALAFLCIGDSGERDTGAGPIAVGVGSWSVLYALLMAGVLGYGPPFDYSIHRYAFLRSYHATELEELAHRWTPLGRIALCERQWSPPLNREARLRPLRFVGMDLGGFSVVEEFTPENLAVIEDTSVFSDDIMEPVVVPGIYSSMEDYLVLMAGNGQDLLRIYARHGDAVDLRGVEVNRTVWELGLRYEPANLEAFFDKPNVAMTIDEGRSFVERTDERFDVISLSYSGATFATGTGSLSLTPQFLFTREAYVSYLEKLRPGGVIVLAESSLPDDLPRSLRTFVGALREFSPGSRPREHVLTYTRPGIVDSRNYTIFHRDPLTADRLAEIEERLAADDLVITYSAFTEPDYPAMERFLDGAGQAAGSETDGGPGFGEGGRQAGFLGFAPLSQDRVHTDDRPFYYLDMVWGFIGGYLVLGYGITLASALLVAVVFLVFPLVLVSRRRADGTRPSYFYHLAFGLLGTGFMLVEVGAIQRFELFLGSPTLSLVVIVGTLLAFTGLGSLYSQRLARSRHLTIGRTCAAIVAYGALLHWFVTDLVYRLMDVPVAAKVAVIAAVLLPLGVLLGTLFPRLLARLEDRHPRFIPWAFAINGIFSVASSNLGVLIYIFFGATTVMWLGFAGYAILGAADSLTAVEGAPDE